MGQRLVSDLVWKRNKVCKQSMTRWQTTCFSGPLLQLERKQTNCLG